MKGKPRGLPFIGFRPCLATAGRNQTQQANHHKNSAQDERYAGPLFRNAACQAAASRARWRDWRNATRAHVELGHHAKKRVRRAVGRWEEADDAVTPGF